MATFAHYEVIATSSYLCSNQTGPISISLTSPCSTTCASVATLTDSSLTNAVCISQATTLHNVMAAMPQTFVAAGCNDQLSAVDAVLDVLQCSKLPISSRNLMTGSSSRPASRVRLAKINSSLLCFLCGGYLIDATTSNRCLHSFCRACILRHLKLVNFCPVCKALLGGTHPHRSLRPDRTLQRVVYKVVPGLYKNERERRRKFAADSRRPGSTHRSHHQKGRPQSAADLAVGSWIYSDDENFSVCLRHQPHLNNASAYWTQFPVTDGDGSNSNTNQLIGCRFVLCPAVTSMQLIKKFVKLKLNLREKSKVLLFCSGEILPDDYTLLDIAYIFSWLKTGPLLIDYVILNIVLSRDDAGRLSCAAAAGGGDATLTEDAQLLPRWNSGYTSTPTNNREPDTEYLAFGLNTNQSGLGVLLDPLDPSAHYLEMSYHKDLNHDRSKQDMTESNISLDRALNNFSHDVLPSFSEIAQLHSSSDTSHPADLGTEDTKTIQGNSRIDYSEDPQTLDYSCEAMVTRTGEYLRPELSTPQFAQTAYQPMPNDNDFGHCLANGLVILPETGVSAYVPPINSSSCGMGGMYSYGEDALSSPCGIQLIGLLAQSVDGSIIRLPDSCFLYNRPVISDWRPGFHETEMDCWRNAGANNCLADSDNRSQGLQFLMPVMHPKATAVADAVANVTGVVGSPVFQCCSANAECVTNSCGERCLPYHDHNFQSLPTKTVFNVDARAEVTQEQMRDDVHLSCQRSDLRPSQTLPVSRDTKGHTGSDMEVYCRDKCNELNRETDVPEGQCIIHTSEGLPQPLPLPKADGQNASTQVVKMYDLSAGHVSEENMVIDGSVAVSTCVRNVLHDSSCSVSVPSEYRMVESVDSHRTSANEYHLPQSGAHRTHVASRALLSVEQHLETLEDSSRLTKLSSDFPATFRCPSPAFKCSQVTTAASVQGLPSLSPVPFVDQNSLEYNTKTPSTCHSHKAGCDTGQKTPRTDAEENSQLSAHEYWDESGRSESLAVAISVSSELTKATLADAAESETGRVEMEPPAVDVEVLARVSFDLTNVIDQSLELTTQS